MQISSRAESQLKYRMSKKGKLARKLYKQKPHVKEKERLRRKSLKYKKYMRKYLDKYQKKDGVKKAREKLRKSWRGKSHTILKGMLSSSKRKGLGKVEFSVDDVFKIIKNGVCCKTGIPFRLTKYGSQAHQRNQFAPSPDRKNNSKGYTKKNVQWVCWMYNQMKGQGTEKDIEKFLTAINNFKGKKRHAH